MEIKEFLTGVLSKTLNVDENGVASLFNEDGTIKDTAEQSILEWDANRVKDLKTATQKTAFDDGHKKATSEALSKFETEFKTKTGYKSEKKGIDLVLEYANSVQPKEGAVTEDVIKKHPLFLGLQEEKDKAVQEAITNGETQLNQFKSELSKKETFGKVSNKALEFFNALKPVLSSDPNRRKAQEELFIERLQGFDYEIQDGERVVITKEGKLYEDAHGKAFTLDRLVKETATKYYDFHAVDGKQNAGNGKDGGKPGAPLNVVVPKNDDEYMAFLVDNTKSTDEKNAVKEAYSKSKQST